MKPFAPLKTSKSDLLRVKGRLVALRKAHQAFSLAASFGGVVLTGDGVTVTVMMPLTFFAPVRAHILKAMPIVAVLTLGCVLCAFACRKLVKITARRARNRRRVARALAR